MEGDVDDGAVVGRRLAADREQLPGQLGAGEEMRTSYLEYAYSVIYTRALPDARDGLKPVQRRLLYTMSEMGLRPERPYVKCSRVVGETMGKYHPHGDTALYDALARMAQDWVMRLPLVDGHGNFGSPDDAPGGDAVHRVPDVGGRVAMTDSLDEDVVDFRPNYDGRDTQPAVLPAALPNLLVNGGSGSPSAWPPTWPRTTWSR